MAIPRLIFWHEIVITAVMQAMSKISVNLLAKILGYAFAGYGLVCDAHFLKAIFHQVKLEASRLTLMLPHIRHEDVQTLQQIS